MKLMVLEPGTTEAGPAENGFQVCVGRATLGRAALEVYVRGALYDVTVAGGLDRALLRGAVRGRRWALAWGLLPPGSEEVIVTFARGRKTLRTDLTVIAGTFWVAEVAGRARSVVVTARDTRVTGRLRYA